MRALAELIDVDDPCWVWTAELIAGSLVPVKVLPPDQAQFEACLHQLQASTRSALGSVALKTGGMLVDHGWLRVYGGCGTVGGMPGLAEVKEFPAEPAPRGLVIGHDVLGGVFAPESCHVARLRAAGELARSSTSRRTPWSGSRWKAGTAPS